MICAHCRNHRGTSAEIREHQKHCNGLAKWQAVVDAKANGTFTKAKRIRRDILGIPTKPMPQEVIDQKQSAPPVAVEAKRRIKALEKAEQRELKKPAYNPRSRRTKSH